MILILNCGSQSIKYKIFDKKLSVIKEKKISIKRAQEFPKVLVSELSEIREGIAIVGHRVVHGGEKFRQPTIITKSNLKELEEYNELAPLHNPFNILGIKVAKKIFPKVKQVAVFDTGFFKDLPQKSYTYGLPEQLRNKYRRFGFHGISHEYASREAAKKLKKPLGSLRVISCHMGGGASIAAIKNGKAVDVSMGFTPLEGLMMMTRSGDIDPGILIKLCGDLGPDQVNDILNKQSGIKGICGESEMLKVLAKVEKGNKKARLALEVFVYRIQKYIGSYYVILGGCDLLVFTGAIGFGSAKIRNMICRDLKILKNTKIEAIKTDEELMIAQKIQNV